MYASVMKNNMFDNEFNWFFLYKNIQNIQKCLKNVQSMERKFHYNFKYIL